MNKWIQIKRDLWDESPAGQPVCRICRKAGATQLHHGIYPKGTLRNRKWHKYIDNKMNAIEVCDQCHDNLPKGARQICYQVNFDRYRGEFLSWIQDMHTLLRLEDNYEGEERLCTHDYQLQ